MDMESNHLRNGNDQVDDSDNERITDDSKGMDTGSEYSVGSDNEIESDDDDPDAEINEIESAHDDQSANESGDIAFGFDQSFRNDKDDNKNTETTNDHFANDRDNFLATYFKLPEKASTTIRFFDRGEFYSVYGSDATYAFEQILGSSGANIKKLKSADSGRVVDYLNVNRSQFHKFVRELLLVKQYRVEVWVNKKDRWQTEFKGSPGNLTQFEELIFSSSEVTVNNGVVGIRISTTNKNKIVGVANVNTNDCILNLMEFVDNDSFTNLESVLVQLNPKEAVLAISSSQTDDNFKIQKILERNNILINECKMSYFETNDFDQDLGRLLKSDFIASSPELESTLAKSAAAGALKYLNLMTNDTYLGQFKLKAFDFGLYVKLDAAACEALHLTQNQLESGNPRNLTLIGTIDRCRTAQGHRLLAQFLRQPLRDKEKIDERLDLVEIFVLDSLLRNSIHEDHLRRVPDYQALARKFMKKKATLQDCYKCYLSLRKLPQLISELDEIDNGPLKKVVMSNFTAPLKQLETDCKKFVDMIETTLDLSLADYGEFMIRPDFDETLQGLRRDMDNIRAAMEKEASAIRNDLNMEEKTLKLETVSHLGFHFRVTLKEEKAMRDQNFIILDSRQGGVRFRTRTMETLNEKYEKKVRAYEVAQKEFKEEVMEVASEYHGSFEQLGNVLALLDVILSFAITCATSTFPYIRPKLHPKGSGILSFEQLHHPCVASQQGCNFIPNDIQFDKGKESFFIITGPNMGGKSTFLRSVGVATLLAHVGCFVPAVAAEVSIVDTILARVGAGDCLEKGVSTFMAEMIETSFIIKTATSDSLVMIDELGRGTSTYDGFGLCWAISEYLVKEVDCFTVMTTHFHELTAMADENMSVANLHVTAIPGDTGLAMLYKLEKGPCDRSFGLHVAEVTDFPPDLIMTAKAMAKVLEDYPQDEERDESEEAVTHRRQQKRDGIVQINEFLAKLAKIDDELLENTAELQTAAENLLNELRASGNSYISHILSSI